MSTNDPKVFLTEGQRVKALIQIVEDPDWVHAEPGDTGVVVFTEPGYYPTVRFDRTDTATIVFPHEVEVLP